MLNVDLKEQLLKAWVAWWSDWPCMFLVSSLTLGKAFKRLQDRKQRNWNSRSVYKSDFSNSWKEGFNKKSWISHFWRNRVLKSAHQTIWNDPCWNRQRLLCSSMSIWGKRAQGFSVFKEGITQRFASGVPEKLLDLNRIINWIPSVHKISR